MEETTNDQVTHGGHYDVYEVFIQRSHLDSHVHVGSVLAPSPDLALHTARENFLRREKAINLWVVRQEQITKTSYEDDRFFAREFDRSYREVGGYAENARRWKAFKQRALMLEDL